MNDNDNERPRTDSQTNPIEQLLKLASMVDPIEVAGSVIDATKRTSESLISMVENLAQTIDNLNRTTTRINSLLDEIEEPLKRLMPQLGGAMNAVATLGEAAQQLSELSRKLGPFTSLAENAGGLFGIRPNRPSETPRNQDTNTAPGTATPTSES